VIWSKLMFALPYLAAVIISAGVGFYALRRRALPGAGYFALLTLAEAVWTAGYLLQTFSTNLPALIFWNSIQFSAVLTGTLGFLGFAFHYTGKMIRFARSALRAAFVLALMIAAVVWLDPFNQALRLRTHIEQSGIFIRLVFEDGPLFFIIPLFTYSIITFGAFLLVANLFSSPRIYRLQVGTVLAGLIIPWGVSLVSWMGLVPLAMYDITPLSFIPSNLLMFWALFRFHLFEVAPIARAMLVERMRDGVIVLDRRRRIIDFNPAAREMLGLSETASAGRFISRELPTLHTFILHLTETPNARSGLSLDVMGMPSRFEASATPLFDSLGGLTGHLVIFRDVTEQKRTEEKLHHLALTDYLTGVFNRRAFFELAVPEFERSRRYHHSLAFIIIDVDNFKKVNDTYGHLVGDQVLESMSRTCQQALREVDTLARYGGEEFVVMLPETDREGARQAAERLRQRVEQQAVSSRLGPVHVTISLGVAVYHPDREPITIDRLLAEADQALYRAKQTGRNRVCIQSDEMILIEV
jgi:diguanylate cyclase (GGDEF)-like protein/PAS domain S-box-containing protein